MRRVSALSISCCLACAGPTEPTEPAVQGSWGGKLVGIHATAIRLEYQSTCYLLRFPPLPASSVGEVTLQGTTILHTSPQFLGLPAELKVTISGNELVGSVRLALPHGGWQEPPREFRVTLNEAPDYTGAGCLI